jgi:hypothetical protein
MTKIDTEIDKTVALLEKLVAMKVCLPATSKCLETAIESVEDWLSELIDSKVVSGLGDIKTIIPEVGRVVYCKMGVHLILECRICYVRDGYFTFSPTWREDVCVGSPPVVFNIGFKESIAYFADYGKTWAYTKKEIQDRADVITVTGSAGFDGNYRRA